ncbi:MAG TPA: hypothetical protein VGL91_03235 [Acidobacteriota bacterium]|jgi:hypothetical protein
MIQERAAKAISDSSVPVAAQLYIATAIVAGLPLFAFSLYRALTVSDPRWLYLAALTVAGSCFAVKIPLMKRSADQSLSITVSDVFIFAALFFFGPAPAVVVAVIEGLVSSYRVKVKRLYKRAFNISQLALAAFVTAQVFQRMQAANLNGRGAPNLPLLLVEAALCAVLYFLLNTAMVCAAISLATAQPFADLWRRNILWFSVANIVNEATAAAIFVYFTPANFSVVLAIIPLALVFYYARHVNLSRQQPASN